MGRRTPDAKNPDYSEVISTVEHHLQCRSPHHPDPNHEESARGMESGDAWRALVEIGAALDRAKRGLLK